MANAKRNPRPAGKKPKKPEPITEMIQAPYFFSEGETADMSKSLRLHLGCIEDLERQAKESAADFKLRISTHKNGVLQLRTKLDSGEETRPVEATVEFDAKKRIKKYFHPTTKEFIREEPMQPADFQLPMFKKEEIASVDPKDPNNDGRKIPPVGHAIVAKGKVKKGDLIWQPTEKKWMNGNSYDGVKVTEAAAVARPDKSPTAPPASTKSPAGKTNLGDVLDKEAALKDAPKIILDPSKQTHDQLTRNFRTAANKAGWSEPQKKVMIAALRACDSVEKMRETIAPHCEMPPPKKPEKENPFD